MAVDKYGLTIGTPELASIGAITFGPDDILFLADSRSATVIAVEIVDPELSTAGPIDVIDLDTQLGSYLGVNRDDVLVRGLAIHPISQAAYLSVMRGRGDAAQPVLIRLSADGLLTDVPLVDVPFAATTLDDAPAEDDERLDAALDGSVEGGVEMEHNGVHFTLARMKLRSSTITDLAWIDGTLLVAGASNEEFASTLRRIPFPFTGEAERNSLEIFHVSHGKYETASPIRTLVPFAGNTSVLASYTCTPLVQFSLTDLSPGALVKGRTVAELGSINQPLDLVTFTQDGTEYLLVSNTRHPLLKIRADAITGQAALTEPTEPIGVARDELSQQGVSHMANLGTGHIVMLQRDPDGALNLHSYATAAL